MTIPELIEIARNRLGYLAAQRETAVRLGDELQIAEIDRQVSQTQDTLMRLLSIA